MSRKLPETCLDAMTVLGGFNNAANLVMQLAHPGVGHGVSKSRVISGAAVLRPIKRARTTTTVFAVALMGTDSDRAVFGAATDDVHKHVHSTADDAVKYSANDPRLQLWVALCLTKYFIDQYEYLYGELPTSNRDKIVASGAALGTTFRVRPEQWPASYAEFTEQWARQLPNLSIDPSLREFLNELADGSFLHHRFPQLGRIFTGVFGPLREMMTRGTVPAEFRTLMGWDWTDRDERAFRRTLAVLRWLDIGHPHGEKLALRMFLLDFRIRARIGIPVLGRIKVAG